MRLYFRNIGIYHVHWYIGNREKMNVWISRAWDLYHIVDPPYAAQPNSQIHLLTEIQRSDSIFSIPAIHRFIAKSNARHFSKTPFNRLFDTYGTCTLFVSTQQTVCLVVAFVASLVHTSDRPHDTFPRNQMRLGEYKTQSLRFRQQLEDRRMTCPHSLSPSPITPVCKVSPSWLWW